MTPSSSFLLRFLVFFGLLFWAPVAETSDFHTPRMAGLGGAGHAGPLLNDALYLNPSFTSFLPAYSLSGNYQMFSSENQNGRIYNVSVQDGRSELFQAGAGYTVRPDGAFVHLGASKSFLTRYGAGLGGKYFLDKDKNDPNLQEMVFSTTGILTNWFHLSLIVDNIIQSDAAEANQLYREVILGTKFNVMSILMAYADPHWTPALKEKDKAWGYEAGLEFTIFKDLFLRMGHFKNAAVPVHQNHRGEGVGLGIGWVGPKLTAEYGLKRVIHPAQGFPNTTSHIFGLNVFF